MNWEKLQGKFIVLDGPDGCGKSTQVRLLAAHLRKNDVEILTLRDPGGTKIGDKIRNILLSDENKEITVRCETLLYMASRAQLYEECIKLALEEGKCVICDRWLSSTYAYQAVGGKLGAQWLLDLAETCLERVWPDLTIIFNFSSKEGLYRVGKGPGRKIRNDTGQTVFEWGHLPDRMEQKNLWFHKRVRKAFLDLAKSRENFCVVDGIGSIEQVHQRIWEIMKYFDSEAI